MTIRPILRILSLRARLDDYQQLGWSHLVLGLIATWGVGVGRYWDNPRASPLQQTGLGSLAYVVVLTAFLWLIGTGLRPLRWSLLHLFTFVTLTAPPGFLYAIPIEMWASPSAARMTNLCFLAAVATWRVLMYAMYLRHYAALPKGELAIQLALPLTLIITALTALNLEHAVFDIMGGVQTTSGDTAYEMLIGLSVISVVLFPFLVVAYVRIALKRRRASIDKKIV